jgi:hypothetical protein
MFQGLSFHTLAECHCIRRKLPLEPREQIFRESKTPLGTSVLDAAEKNIEKVNEKSSLFAFLHLTALVTFSGRLSLIGRIILELDYS